MSEIAVVPLDQLEMRFAPRPWPFAIERRAEIDACFAQLQRDKPALWNGRVLLMHHHTIVDGKLHGDFLETDFASMLAWRAFDFPDKTIRACFPMSALHAADGAFLLGLMGSHTANGGQLYFPTGTPDPEDVRGDKVDFDSSLLRELAEETGLSPADVSVAPGWHALLAGPRMPLIKMLHVDESAAALRARILAHLAREEEPELADILVVRGPADLDPRMPSFVKAFLTDFWSKRA
jgi:8-oxo-dGTP pyrophosphatase MutT (NUDIX family)